MLCKRELPMLLSRQHRNNRHPRRGRPRACLVTKSRSATGMATCGSQIEVLLPALLQLRAAEDRHLKQGGIALPGTELDREILRHADGFGLADHDPRVDARLGDRVHAWAGEVALDTHVEDALAGLVPFRAEEDQPQGVIARAIALGEQRYPVASGSPRFPACSKPRLLRLR